MKKSINNSINKTASLALILTLLSGCSDYFDNPLKDDETGEDINVLIVDFNFFTTRMTFKLFDAKDGSAITSPARLQFSGKNGDDIVTFAGEKKPAHTTSQGQLELTVDPNVSFSASAPFEFALNVEVAGYNTLDKGYHISSEGKKTYELYMVKTADEEDTDLDGEIDINDGDTTIVFNLPPNGNIVKSVVAEEKPFRVNFKIPFSDFLKLKDANGNFFFENYTEMKEAYESNPSGFASFSVSKYSGYGPGADVIYYDGMFLSVLFQKLETGTLTSFKVLGREVADLNGVVITSYATYTGENIPDLFGFVDFDREDGAWYFNEPYPDTTIYATLNISYTLAQAENEGLCETGSSIAFSSNVISSFSFDADVYDMDGNLINTINFKGNFPETFTVENAPSEAVKLVFRDNNPSFAPLPDLEIENFCSGNYNVSVTPANGYEQYQIVLKALCPDNPTVAVAPTYSGEIKIKGSSDPWQGVDMVGGKVDLLGKPDTEYELRLLWEEDWEYSTYSTFFNAADGSYAGEDYPKTVIESAYMENGARIRINVEKEFEQNICDDLGW